MSGADADKAAPPLLPSLPAPLRDWLPVLVTALVLAVAPLLLPLIAITPDVAGRVLIWGLFGLGFDLLFGFTGLLSFGQSAFYGLGGFAAAYLVTSQAVPNILLATVLGTVAAAIAGGFVGLLALRRTGIYFAMITLAFAEMFFFLDFSVLSRWTGGENGLPNIPGPRIPLGFATLRVGNGWSMYAFLAVCFILGLILARRIVASPVGHILRAIRENPQRAAAVGHNVRRYKLLVFVIAAAYAGFAGGCLGMLQGYMPPEAFNYDTSGQLVMQTVIGGVGTLYGPLVGAAVWLGLGDFLQYGLGLGAAWKLVLGLVFVLLVCLLRHGVVGGVRDLWGSFGGRHAGSAAESEAAIVPLFTAPPIVVPPTPANAPTILEARGLTKRYGGLIANNDVNLRVAEGELRAVIGPNGAGKSTFFKMLTGEVIPTTGTILFRGQDITAHDVTDVCQKGLTKSYQVNQLFAKLSVRENIVIAALSQRRGRFRPDLLSRLDHLPDLAERVDDTLRLVDLAARADRPVSALAYGEKRRLEIGLALATAPSVLLLDEPLAGMSPPERVATIQLLKSLRAGRTMVVVEHDMDAVFELAERITVLVEGRVLAEGTPAEIQQNPYVQDAYLGGIDAA
jgi:branched-chain amino acid transport system permease protein